MVAFDHTVTYLISARIYLNNVNWFYTQENICAVYGEDTVDYAACLGNAAIDILQSRRWVELYNNQTKT